MEGSENTMLIGSDQGYVIGSDQGYEGSIISIPASYFPGTRLVTYWCTCGCRGWFGFHDDSEVRRRYRNHCRRGHISQ